MLDTSFGYNKNLSFLLSPGLSLSPRSSPSLDARLGPSLTLIVRCRFSLCLRLSLHLRFSIGLKSYS